MRVRDLMIRGVPEMSPEASISHALDLMEQTKLGALPVIDANGRCLGVVTNDDVREVARDPLLRDFCLFHFMRIGCHVVDANESIERATCIADNGHYVIVVSGSQFEGLLACGSHKNSEGRIDAASNLQSPPSVANTGFRSDIISDAAAAVIPRH